MLSCMWSNRQTTYNRTNKERYMNETDTFKRVSVFFLFSFSSFLTVGINGNTIKTNNSTAIKTNDSPDKHTIMMGEYGIIVKGLNIFK